MHNLSHHSVVIQVPFPEGTGKLAMTVMPLFNSSLKIYEKPQFGRLKGCIYKPGLIHTLFVYALVLHCPFLFSFFLFFFSFLHGKFIHAGISAGCCLFKAQNL